jgi:hypothetical protein
MLTNPIRIGSRSARRRKSVQRAVLVLVLLVISSDCMAKMVVNSDDKTPAPTPTPIPTATDTSQSPLTDRERAMLELIKGLQERVTKLEAQVAGPAQAKILEVSATDSTAAEAETAPLPPASAKAPQKKDERSGAGTYTPNLGFKIVDTPYGDLNVSLYTYVRYLNQKGLNPTYEDAFGNTKNVQQRQDIQIQKLQFKFLGWILSPKLRYFLYAWTSNATQGQGAQVVLAGNLGYTFNRHLTLAGGIRSLPGTRSVEGNFPFWMNVDSRMIADEFMRPSYTSGFWATGEITKRLKYQVMLGNNMSTLGVPASRLDNGLNTLSSALLWFPTGDFEQGFSGQGWGDFEHHEKFSTRFGFHFSRSDENKESQPGSDVFENTQLRLSDGTVIFTPNLFGQDTAITDARWRMTSFDGGFKYKGYSLEGEYYWRWLDKFRGTNVQGIPSVFDHGFQMQGAAMVIPKTLQVYAGHSRIFGQYGDPFDFRVGTNWFPYQNHVLRWNTEALYLRNSPVGYSSVPFALGSRGWVFHSSLELAF